ncbi:hypothetical protein D3C78_1393960 [compost metagenome]
MIDENGNSIKVSNLRVGQTINVNYNGTTPTKLQVAKLTLGKVSSIDGSTFSLKSFNGSVETFSVGANIKVQRGNSVSTSITSLTNADHVEVRKAADGGIVVKVLTSIERKVSRYNSTTKELSVIRTSFSDDNYKFAVSSETYIHEGDTTLSVQSLKENDKIVLYFNGDKLVEIEKQ